MKQFTSNQKFAILSVLSQIMNADGLIHPKEEEYLNKMYVELGVKIGDVEDMTNIDDIQAKQIVRDLTDDQKDYVLSLFVSMAESDGYVHPKELVVIGEIFAKL